jgi:isopentenyl diphosphate isomerase/L-lactate dehydrogenase-like FMN-dependent dehydrogenase
LEVCMALAGCARIEDIQAAAVQRAPNWPRSK